MGRMGLFLALALCLGGCNSAFSRRLVVQSEATPAVAVRADPADIGLTIHPHPTLSETFNFAAEMVEGTITDLYVPKKRKKS